MFPVVTSQVNATADLNVMSFRGKHIGLHVGQLLAVAHTIPAAQTTFLN
jgi:hypothetical protein